MEGCLPSFSSGHWKRRIFLTRTTHTHPPFPSFFRGEARSHHIGKSPLGSRKRGGGLPQIPRKLFLCFLLGTAGFVSSRPSTFLFLPLGDAAALLSSFLRCVPPSPPPPFYPRLTPPLTYLQEVSSSSFSSSAQDAATLDKSVAGFAKFLVGSSVSLPNNQLKHQRKFFSEILFGPLVISSMFPEIRLQLRPILPFCSEPPR